MFSQSSDDIRPDVTYVAPVEITAAVDNLPILCIDVVNDCIIVVKLLASVPADGNSQSISTPSTLYWLQKLTILLIKVVRRLELATMVWKASPPPPPPTDISTFALWLCAFDTNVVNF